MATLKLVIITALTIAFFWLLVFGPFYDRVAVQTAVLAGVAVWNTARFSWRATLALLKFCLPFVASLLVFGIFFHFMRLQGRDDWLSDTLIKCLVFPSSLIYIKILLSYVTYLDILQLPISMKRRVDLISMKSAFQRGGIMLRRFSWYLGTYTGFETDRRLKNRMTRFACLIIALYLYLYEEIENSGRLLQNRYRHLKGKD